MFNLKYLAPIVALSLTSGAVADTSDWLRGKADLSACKKAVQKHLGSSRGVEFHDDYWISKQSNDGKRILVNAKFRNKSVRGTCNFATRLRVGEVSVAPGRFVESAYARDKIAKVDH